jgi:Tol biopolymer transport system component
MHEPNSALSIHDRWTGKGKNMRITPPDITAFDPVWSMDGKRVYFIGYRDTQASEADLFRIWRVERFGGGLRE